MFTRGSSGFSGMLNGLASGNPGIVYHSVTWNASNVYHQPILSNAIFASIQFLIAFGIVYKRTCKPALALSIVWALGVWWFGESAGEIFQGGATPFGGGPGGVLFYAVLAVLLWPSEGSDRPFVAARTVGLTAARAIWAVVWGVLAILSLVGSGRSPQALHDLVAGVDNGQPGWLAHIDRSSESLFLHHGTTMAILLAVVCVVVAAGVFAPPTGRPGDRGSGHRGLRAHLGGSPELRWDPGRGRHRPELRSARHPAGLDLLAVGDPPNGDERRRRRSR